MKFPSILIGLVAFELGLHGLTAQAVRTTTKECSSCSVGTYCTESIAACHGPPKKDACYNATINEYQTGCARGYDCMDNMCECVIEDSVDTVSKDSSPVLPASSVCYLKCNEPDQFCENGTHFCRGLRYETECFNVATGHYQDGCSAGYVCTHNKCTTV